MQSSRALTTAAMVLLASGCVPARAQTDALPAELNIPRNSGDSVQPVFDGWQRYPDGSTVMWFGYLNRNYKQQLDIPIGPNNGFTSDSGQLAAADQGQPTHFYTRRHQYVFKIDVPKNCSNT